MPPHAGESQGSQPTIPHQGKRKRAPSFLGIWNYLFILQMEMLHDLFLLLQIHLNTRAQAEILYPGAGARSSTSVTSQHQTSLRGAAVKQSHRQVLRLTRQT